LDNIEIFVSQTVSSFNLGEISEMATKGKLLGMQYLVSYVYNYYCYQRLYADCQPCLAGWPALLGWLGLCLVSYGNFSCLCEKVGWPACQEKWLLFVIIRVFPLVASLCPKASYVSGGEKRQREVHLHSQVKVLALHYS